MREEEEEDACTAGSETDHEQKSPSSQKVRGEKVSVWLSLGIHEGTGPRISMDAQVPQLTLRIQGSISADSTNPGSCSTIVFTEKNLCISGSVQSKPMLFKVLSSCN